MTEWSVFELRQYTLHPGRRDDLIGLFEREFVESQEQLGMRLVGQFRDLDDPDRFVWIRAFRELNARPQALKAFYGGPVWKAHREQANVTMVDSSDVLLLRPAGPGPCFAAPASPRPPPGATERPTSTVVVTLCHRAAPVDDEFLGFFEQHIKPVLTEAGGAPLACLQTEDAENTFPALPVREGEHVFAWVSAFPSVGRWREHVATLSRSPAWSDRALPQLSARLHRPPRTLRLEPTPRSLLR
jgi:quinol monooxygenase YgiN